MGVLADSNATDNRGRKDQSFEIHFYGELQAYSSKSLHVILALKLSRQSPPTMAPLSLLTSPYVALSRLFLLLLLRLKQRLQLSLPHFV
jgi:hypothetical protein